MSAEEGTSPTPAGEVAERLAAAASEYAGSAPTAGESFGLWCVDVPREAWVGTLTAARDVERLTYFDWLSGVDELADGFSVVTHLLRPEDMVHLLVRTRIPLDDPRLPTATGVFRGASWHERETAEMFGIDFEGHPNLVPLLLPDGFSGYPLRKEFVLASRVVKPWPGAKEPGEPAEGRARRRAALPPGVPADWGPNATPAGEAAAPERPERPERRERRPRSGDE